ncbi:MAG: hypothetical protein ACK5MI_05180 [Mangrovibacterium sp.]
MRKTFSLFMIACLTFWGCEKETLQKTNDTQVSDLVSSRLSFDSQGDFDQVIE